MQRIQAPENPTSRARRLSNEVQSAAASATTVPALRDQVAKLAEAVELLLTDKE